MELTVSDTRIFDSIRDKFLEVIIDDRLNFKEHVKYIGEKATVTQGSLAKMIRNFGAPDPHKRRIILAVVTSTMLYACPIWSEALFVETTRRILCSVYLSTIRRIRGSRTVSDEEVLIKTVDKIDILEDEMKRMYLRCPEHPG